MTGLMSPAVLQDTLMTSMVDDEDRDRERLEELRTEHRDLDEVIARLWKPFRSTRSSCSG